MISADNARALMSRKLYEEKVKEYEEKIERDVTQAAKNNESSVYIILKDEDPLLHKAIEKVLQNFTDNGFEILYAWVDHDKYVIYVSW